MHKCRGNISGGEDLFASGRVVSPVRSAVTAGMRLWAENETDRIYPPRIDKLEIVPDEKGEEKEE